MARIPATLCFDALLSNVLDFCHLEELLLCAMPVCRSWRAQVIDHRTYWGDLALAEQSVNLERSESLFLLRLSRTRARPIRIYLRLRDPRALLPTLLGHLHHTYALSMHFSPSAAEAVFQAFRARPASLLNQLALSFYPDTLESWRDGALTVPTMPSDLFSSHAPALRDVDVFDVALPTGGEFPACLRSITKLRLQFTVGLGTAPVSAPQRVLPDISVYFPRLEQLAVGPEVILDAPVFWRAETWSRIRAVTFHASKLSDGRSVSELPLGAVPRITLGSYSPVQSDHDDIIALLEAAMPGPLHVAIPWESTQSGSPSACVLRWRMTALQNARRVERWVDTVRPRRAQDAFPFDRPCALQEAPLAARVVRLSLSLADWDVLVGGGHFVGGFAALETLVLALATDPSNSFWRTDAGPKPSQLFCPRLHRLALTHTCAGRFPRAVDIALIASFVRESLPDAQLPVSLELKEVDTDGPYTEYPDVFSSVALSARDSTDNAKWE